ncbi:MAG: hypothetical protein LBH95_04885, partial [Oscillospiraceae bacterium]|nr:hypothetical protein [Oscillospiraceae bacterium]
MSVTVTKTDGYQNFGACVHITNGVIELYATTGRGPRIIHLSLCGGENLFWTDTGSQAVTRIEGLDLAFGKGDEYHILGGHRLWSSPEHVFNSYYPDSDPVDASVTPRGVILSAPPQKGTGLQFTIEVRMDPAAPRVSVRHRIQNTGDGIVMLAPWAITQLAPGGLEVFPQSKQDITLLPDRVFVVWPYTDMGDHRLRWGDEFVSLRPDATPRSLKIGTLNRKGYALYQNKGVVFKKMWNPLPRAEYPDYGCSFETYTNHLFLEMESTAPLSTL